MCDVIKCATSCVLVQDRSPTGGRCSELRFCVPALNYRQGMSTVALRDMCTGGITVILGEFETRRLSVLASKKQKDAAISRSPSLSANRQNQEAVAFRSPDSEPVPIWRYGRRGAGRRAVCQRHRNTGRFHHCCKAAWQRARPLPTKAPWGRQEVWAGSYRYSVRHLRRC